MISNLKTLGLAVFAVFAMSAIAASAASADVLTAEFYPATVTGASETGTVDTFTTTAGKWKCPNATYQGTISAASTTLTLTPNFNGPNDTCTSLAGIVPTIADVNGCDYRFHIGTGASTTGTTDIECPAGKEITFTANQNTAGTLTGKCTIHVPPQSLGGITYSVVGVGTTREIKIVFNATGITYTETAGSGLGACSTSILQHDGTLAATWRLTGETDGGTTHIGLFLSENAAI